MALSSFILKIKLYISYESETGATITGYPMAQVRDGGTLGYEEAVMKYLVSKNY